MLMFAALAAMAAATTGTTGVDADVDALHRLWPGAHDSNEQTIVNMDHGLVGWTEDVEHRVRTIVAPIDIPSLGKHVLYLEEFVQDEPDELRRQMVLALEPQGPPEAAVRVHLFSLRNPAHWRHLDRQPNLAGTLKKSDLIASPGCDLVFVREGEQFRGGTVGHDCRAERDGARRVGPERYVDYQLVIGDDLYWYRRRIQRTRDDQVSEEVMGYNWFELDESQLYTCRIDFSSSGRRADLKPLQRLELRDEGGRARFTTPDGHMFELTLHNQDWPYAMERDALILMLLPQGSQTPLSVAWADANSEDVSLNTGWLRVRCGPLAPDTDDLRGALSAPGFGYPAAGWG